MNLGIGLNLINFFKTNFYYGSFLNKNYNTFLQYIYILYAFSTPFMKQFNRPVTILMLLIWILDGNFKNKLKIAFTNKTFLAFTVFIGYNYISLLWTDEFNQSLSYVNGYFPYFAFVVIWTSIKKEFIPKILGGFIAGMFLSEIITYGIYLDLWTTTYNIKNPSASPTAFMSHSGYAAFVALIVLILLNKIIYEKSYLKYFYMIFLISTFGNLVISGGRTGVIAFVVTIFIYLIYTFKKQFLKIITILSIFTLLFYLSYNNIKFFKQRSDAFISNINQALSHKNYNTSIGLRMALLAIGYEVFQEKPIFGHGIYDNIKERVRVASLPQNKEFSVLSRWAKKANYHNNYMEILTQLGLVGLLIFLYIFYSLATTTIHNQEYKNYKIIFISIIMTTIISGQGFHHRAPIAIFSLLIAIILAQHKAEQEDTKATRNIST